MPRNKAKSQKTNKILSINLSTDHGNLRTKIIKALSNPKYKSRTISGISKEIGIDNQRIIKAIKQDNTLVHIVKILPYRSKDGRPLITTKDRFSQESSLKERFIDFFASHRVEIEDVE